MFCGLWIKAIVLTFLSQNSVEYSIQETHVLLPATNRTMAQSIRIHN